MKIANRAGRPALVLATACAAALLAWADGQAEYIYLNDGTVIRGRLEREGLLHIDHASKEDFWIPKAGGFYQINDFARRFVFSQRNVVVAQPDPDDTDEARETYQITQALKRNPGAKVLKEVVVIETGPWNKDGIRKISYTDGDAPKAVVQNSQQCITVITPTFIRAGTQFAHWNCSFLPSEFKPEELIAIIRKHLANPNTKPKLSELDQRLSVMRYCVQVGWFEEAEREIDEIAKEFPGEGEKLEASKKKLQGLRAARWQTDIEFAVRSGQHQLAREHLKQTPAGASDAAVKKMNSQAARYKEKDVALTEARRFLKAERAAVAKLPTTFNRALDAVEKELNIDTVNRLDTFVRLTKQEERNRANGRNPEYQPLQLLAFAVSGWVMGSAGADADPAVAHALWYTREFLLKYLVTDSAKDRSQMLRDYLTPKPPDPQPRMVDEIVHMIDLLPPAAAEEKLPAGPAEYKTSAKTAYTIVLPPEYHHHRAYPVLVALPNIGEQAKESIKRLAETTGRQGYILVVPDWGSLAQDKYSGTEQEHEAVVAALKDARRRFQLDSERIFLTGFDESGKMAYDVGLSHPDLFAGVVVMSGRPDGNAFNKNSFNAQYLPFYVVDGQFNAKNMQAGKVPENVNRPVFKRWVPYGYPALYVEYTGRAQEFFAGELPSIFQWMEKKKRAKGLPELGRSEAKYEFISVRNGDNRFYWITFEPDQRDSKATPSIAARIADANHIHVRSSGLKGFTVWLNTSMVDFDQPVTVRVVPSIQIPNGLQIKKELTPELKVLLEDFYLRGDKKNLFVARIEVP